MVYFAFSWDHFVHSLISQRADITDCGDASPMEPMMQWLHEPEADSPLLSTFHWATGWQSHAAIRLGMAATDGLMQERGIQPCAKRLR